MNATARKDTIQKAIARTQDEIEFPRQTWRFSPGYYRGETFCEDEIREQARQRMKTLRMLERDA